MAVDSAAKRFSMLGLNNPIVLLRVPAGSVGVAQRRTLVHLYEGIALDEPAVEVPVAPFGVTSTITSTLGVASLNALTYGVQSSGGTTKGITSSVSGTKGLNSSL